MVCENRKVSNGDKYFDESLKLEKNGKKKPADQENDWWAFLLLVTWFSSLKTKSRFLGRLIPVNQMREQSYLEVLDRRVRVLFRGLLV